MTDGRLGARGISRRFGQVLALDDVSFSVAPGRIHALLGENGAGKTTLIRALSGLDRPDSGTVVVDGEPAKFRGPRDAFDAGIAVVQQELALSPELTMLENLVLGMEPVRRGRIDWSAARRDAEEIAESIGAHVPWDDRASTVPVGTRQQLEIVRMIYRGAETLILDEPSAVLAPKQIEKLLDLMRALRERGKTIVFISHKLAEVQAVADEVTVLRRGRVVATRPVADLDRRQLAELVVGEQVDDTRVSRRRATRPVALSLESVLVRGRRQPVGPIDLEVREGEVLGVAGVAGNGQDELIEAIAGIRPVAGGRISVGDADVTDLPVNRRRAAGLSYISADRKGEGLSTTQSLADNVVLGRHRRAPITRNGVFSPVRARKFAADLLERHGVRYGRVSEPASTLSGGNQQKTVVARELALEPTVLLAAQPTRGVDVKGIRDLHGELLQARNRGVAVLLLSQELDELLAVSDRVMVIYGGRANGTFDPEDADARHKVGEAMLSTSRDAAGEGVVER